VPHYLLLGAGFSRNWGGWLANETLEYLLGSPLIDGDIRSLLWEHRRQGGFEGALGVLQDEFFRSRNPASERRLTALENALIAMFNDMLAGFARLPFEFHSSSGRFEQETQCLVQTFLTRFDAIFTLNQDLLLEKHYLLRGQPWGRWAGFEMPGFETLADDANLIGTLTPGRGIAPVRPDRQPFIKLHGSSNWKTGDGRNVLVMGANKQSIINRFPVLQWNHLHFQACLSALDARLMVIGYSFGDPHINAIIRTAAAAGHLRIFLIDPLGLEVIDENRHVHMYSPGPLMSDLGPRVIGASRRSLREIFGFDIVEHAKVMRFFS
jgi:hypothetical protein